MGEHELEMPRRAGEPEHGQLVLALHELALQRSPSETATGSCTREGSGLTITTDAQAACTPSAKVVDRIARSIHGDGDDLAYELSMAAVGQPLTVHLRSQLTRHTT